MGPLCAGLFMALCTLLTSEAGLLKPKQRGCGISPVFDAYTRTLHKGRPHDHTAEHDDGDSGELMYVTGGQEAIPPGKWPWMVYLTLNDFIICGGSLISPNWVITANHCLPHDLERFEKNWTINVGVHNTTQMGSVVQTSRIEKLYRYGDSHDIALIKLTTPVSIHEEFARPVCLPESEKYRKARLVGRTCVVTGWGVTDIAVGVRSEVLHEANVNILRDSKCGKYEDFKKESQLCAGKKKGGADACQQDSGGPLVCKLDRRWTLVGIVSYGHKGKCGDPDWPGVYINVGYKPFKKWIRDVTRGTGKPKPNA